MKLIVETSPTSSPGKGPGTFGTSPPAVSVDVRGGGFLSVARSQGLVPRTVHAKNGNDNLVEKVAFTGPFNYLNQCEVVLRLDDVTDVYTKLRDN